MTFSCLSALQISFVVGVTLLVGVLAYAVGDPAIRVLWETPLAEPNRSPFGIPAAAKGRLFVVTSQIEAYSTVDGRRLWQAPIGPYIPRKLVTDGRILVVAEKSVSALAADTGRRLWEMIPDGNSSLGRAAITHGSVYFGTDTHRLYALRARDGKERWVIDLGPEWEFAAVVRGIFVHRRTLYVSLEQWRTPNGEKSSGWLIAVDARTGRVRWRFATGVGEERHGFSSSPVVTARLVIGADYLSNALVAVDRDRGFEVWRFRGKPDFVGFPEGPLVARQAVYAASGDTSVYALELSTGKMRWRTKMSAASEDYVLCGESLLVNQGGLTAIDPNTGKISQVILRYDDSFGVSGFAVLGKTAFVAGEQAVYALGCR